MFAGGAARAIAQAVPKIPQGYFCATVGTVDEKTIREYIENQQWDQDDQGFKITASTEP